jgi:hypothetical protein
MATHRRKEYQPRDRYSVYHDSFDNYQKESRIISSGQETMPSIKSIIWDRRNIEGLLLEYAGNDQGIFYHNGEAQTAYITLVKEKLAKLDKAFKDYCTQVVRQGKRKPTEWPAELLAERYQTEAKLDVMTWEIEMLRERLKTYTEKEQEVSDTNILKSGPRGVSQLHAGFIISLDGMKVSRNAEEISFIDDARAPMFDGYAVADYIDHIVTPWAYDRATQAKKTANEAKEKGLSLDSIVKGKRAGTNAPWPKMPEDCINYKVKIKEESK